MRSEKQSLSPKDIQDSKQKGQQWIPLSIIPKQQKQKEQQFSNQSQPPYDIHEDLLKEQDIGLQDESPIKLVSQAEQFFNDLQQQETHSHHQLNPTPTQSPSNSPFLKFKNDLINQHHDPNLQKTINYSHKLSQQSSNNLQQLYKDKKSSKVKEFQTTPFAKMYQQGVDVNIYRTVDYQHGLGKGDDDDGGLNNQYMQKKAGGTYQKDEGESIKRIKFQPPNIQSHTSSNKLPLKKDSLQQKHRTSIMIPNTQRQQLIFQDQIDLKKQLIFSLILTFIFLHAYYAIVYKLQLFTIVNLTLIIVWITISPHHQECPTIKSEDKQFQKVLLEFIKSRLYHLRVNKPIFKLIFCNFLIVDLGLLKIAIGKFGIFHEIISAHKFLADFYSKYVDMNFINTLKKITVKSWNILIEGLAANNSTESNPEEFFLIRIFQFFTKILHWIYAILSGIFTFLSSFFTEFALNGQYFLYLALIILCTILAFKNFFRVSQNVQKVIDKSLAQRNEEKTNKDEKKPIKEEKKKTETQKNQRQIPLLPPKMKQQSQRSQLQQAIKKKRKSSICSNLSQVQIFTIKKPLEESEQSPIYQQLSKYLLISSLFFMYGFCFLAEDSNKFLFFQSISVKQVWSLVLCLYAFLIVEYCKRNQLLGQRVIYDQRWFSVKCYITTLLIVILILHDFVISKNLCDGKVEEGIVVANIECFYAQSKYQYYFRQFFFNSHLKQTVLPQDKIKLNIFVQYVMKIVILLNLRFHKFYLFRTKKALFTPEEQSRFIDDDSSSVDNPNLAESLYTVNTIGGVSTQSYKLKRKVAKISKALERNTILLLICTILIMTLTNSISNIVILLGTFLSLPSYKDTKFRSFLMLGLTMGILLQPNQFLYFALSIIMLYVRGQDMQFKMHSHWIVIQLSRLYIMFSKVSVINFLMGLIPSSVLVMYCLGFRIVFNYLEWISVFMGTEDNYTKSYFYNLVPHSFFVDFGLWIFMILLKTYTPNLVNKFPNSNITNIFQQYPVIQKVQPILKLFKIIQLVAYVTIQLIVFTQTPSIIVFIRLFMHLIIAAVDLAYERANETLKNLWKGNLYVSLFIAFLKYFYLLNRYQNLSGWLLALLSPLEKNWSIIGLWPAQREESIFALCLLFLPDLCIIILSMLVEYSLQVKIFQSYRALFVLKQHRNQHQDSNSQNNSHSSKLQPPHQIQPPHPIQPPHVLQSPTNTQPPPINQSTTFILPNKSQKQKQRDIQYLYKNYIKELSFKFKDSSVLGRVLSDFLYDVYFLLLCVVYFILENTQSFAGCWLNLSHFVIAFVIFIHQQDRRLPKKTFIYSIIYSCATILLLYLQYLYSYMTFRAKDGLKANDQFNDQSSYFYKLSDILNKYILFLLGCLFYKLHDSLKEQLEMERNKDRRRNMLYALIMPTFQKGFTHTYVKEITILWINLFKSAILAIFVANLFTSTSSLLFSILMAAYLLIIINYPHPLGFHALEDTLKHFWVYPFLLSFCFTLWSQHLIGYLGLIMIRVYIIFFMEFELSIDFLFCEYVTESQRHLVEKIDDRFNRKSIDKLSIIPEEKEGISKVVFSSEDEESSRIWRFKNLYKTILLILPQLCLLLMLSSQLILYKNYLSAVMCLVILVMFFYSTKYMQRKEVFNKRMKKVIKVYFGVFFVITVVIFTFGQYNSEVSLRLGVGCLCLGFFYLMYLVQDVQKENEYLYLISKALRVVFMQARCQQALQYWSIKSQFVSELGSQIHNQKKLLKLQKFYITKEKVSRRVQKLIQDLQQRGQRNFRKNYSAADFDIIDQIIDYKDQGTKYQLFSNMLLVLSLQDLQYCLQLMNHYYRPCIQKNNRVLKTEREHILGESEGAINEMMTLQMREIRSNVLNVYHGSIYLAFKQYQHSLREERRQNTQYISSSPGEKLIVQSPTEKLPLHHSQIHHPKEQQYSQCSQEQQMVNLQKAQFMNQKYQQCMQRIHYKSMQIPWLWRKLIQNSQIVSLVIVTGWNFFGGVYAIPANFAIFAWALVLETKTTVLLWSFFFLYSGFIILFKFILPQLPSLPILNFIFYYYPSSFYYQFIIIVVSVLQIFVIKLGGTEHVTYSERETIYDAFYRKGLNKAAHRISSELQPQFIQVYKTLSQPSRHSFFYRVFSKSRLKPGKDFYPLTSGIQLLILMYIFFFYDMMEFESRNNRKSLGEILTINQFSKHMMLFLFTQVVIMIVDRCIASLNLIDAKNQALENFLLNFAFSDHIKYRAPESVTHVGFFDFLLVLKYLFHIFLLILINFFVYFYIPSSGFEKSLIPQCQNATCGKSYTFLSIFLLLYLAYFVVSGLQIKHGFSRDKCRNKLMEKHHWVNYYVYVLFTGIPFLWEFKKICDWTITTTALPLFHWMKFQDINARLYQSKCQAEMLKIKPRAKTPLSKYFLGPIGCIFILAVVFSPLLLYSSLNPFAVKDEVLAAQVKLNFLVNGSVQYKFFSTSHAIVTQNITKLSESYRDQFQTDQTIHSFINFEDNNDFYLKMSSYPDENFKISEPAVEKLSARIGRALSGRKYRFFDMVLHTKVIEKQGGQNTIEWAKKRLDDNELNAFKEFVLPSSTPISNTTNATAKPHSKYFKLQNFYSPIPGTIQNKTICLITTNDGQYYQLYTPDKITDQCIKVEQQGKDQNPGILLFYSSSTKYKISFGLVTFYVTYVLLISRLFRLYLTGNLDNVIYEGCHLERMLILCDAVRQARILQNLYQEEYLYDFMVDLMRNPRTLKQMSGDFTELRSHLPLK